MKLFLYMILIIVIRGCYW